MFYPVLFFFFLLFLFLFISFSMLACTVLFLFRCLSFFFLFFHVLLLCATFKMLSRLWCVPICLFPPLRFSLSFALPSSRIVFFFWRFRDSNEHKKKMSNRCFFNSFIFYLCLVFFCVYIRCISDNSPIQLKRDFLFFIHSIYFCITNTFLFYLIFFLLLFINTHILPTGATPIYFRHSISIDFSPKSHHFFSGEMV